MSLLDSRDTFVNDVMKMIVMGNVVTMFFLSNVTTMVVMDNIVIWIAYQMLYVWILWLSKYWASIDFFLVCYTTLLSIVAYPIFCIIGKGKEKTKSWV